MSVNIFFIIIFLLSSYIFSANLILDHALPKLSDYNFFKHPIKDQIPEKNILPYSIASPLFSDYAEKIRFIYLPENTTIAHNNEDGFHYPEGTFLIKTFYYPNDFRDKNGSRFLVETRLLKKTKSEWISIPYVWNKDQNEAELSLAGARTNVSWIHYDGKPMNLLYSIPNVNQCKSCHVHNNILKPIGPKIRNLNNAFHYSDGKMNQLKKWISKGILMPLDNFDALPRTVNYENSSDGSINERARAWLDINCAHCHQRGGRAESSGLYLDLEENNPRALGVNKPPIAAGRGSGQRKYNIVPGYPEESIIEYRINSTDPGIMMPELSRKLVHQEGLELIREWIKNIPKDNLNN